jgi:four helix bundle protein
VLAELDMARPKSYRDLIVWQKAMALARRTYAITEELPKSEAYGLLSQIRRAAVSIPSNIAEGQGRLTDLQFRHFLGTARGSLYEMQTQLELAGSLVYLDERLVRKLMGQGAEVARLINGLIPSLTQGKRAETQASQNCAANELSEHR